MSAPSDSAAFSSQATVVASGANNLKLSSLPTDKTKPSTRQQVIGIALISVTACLWVLSSELSQYIYADSNYFKPLLLTYLSNSMFSVYLLGLLQPSWRAILRGEEPADSVRDGYHPLADAEDQEDYQPYPPVINTVHVDSESSVASFSFIPSSLRYMFGSAPIIRAVLVVTPLFFTGNYIFNWSLEYTSVASASTVSSLSSLFSLIVGALIQVENFSVLKLLSALLSITGVAIISGYDSKSLGGILSVGDIACVVSAFIYSLYTIALKLHSPSDNSPAKTAIIFALIGALGTVTLWPLLIAFHVLRWEVFVLPSPRVSALLLLNCFLGSVLPDFLWALSVGMTTPLIATLALSLTMPISLLFDLIFRSMTFTTTYMAGVVLVLFGFFAANVEEAWKRSVDSES